VEGEKKLIAPKLYSLFKCQGHSKAKVSMHRVDVGTFYFNKDFMHAKNKHCYIVVNCPFILDRLQINVPSKGNENMFNLLLLLLSCP
jgi:hypothetical protein